ncbi:MAG: efflux RND transporter periplasmic adaptor subunit, partial [Planctomycetes bacterium]|nr:efflux RND transporter periplasmic adaptor subunit [Planctomycetota bacterium]
RDRAMATDAEAEADRLAGLFERGQANDRERDQSRATADAQHAQVAAREAEVELARLDLEHCRIKSPIDGRAGSYKVNVGNVVKLNDTELLTMNQIAPIYVTFSVPERYLEEIRRMQASEKLPVEAHPGDSDESPQPGWLVFLDNQIDRSTGMVRLKALFDNADRRLWPGRFVRINLSLTAIANALVVPDTAVQPGATGPIVFVVDESGKCSVREVVTGPTQGGRTVIAEGLVGGEIVVTDGQLRLTPGALVSIQNSPTSAPAAASAPGLAVENDAARPAAAEAKR